LSWQNTPYAWTLFVTAALSAGLAWLAWQRRHVPGARTLTLLLLANVIWSFTYGLELSTPDLAWQILWAKVEYFGIVSAPVLWFAFVLRYTRQEAWLTRRKMFGLSVMPTIFILLAWTNESHHLIWAQVGQTTEQGAKILTLEHGLAFFGMAAYCYLMLLLGALILLRAIVNASVFYRKQIGIMLVGAFVPWIGNILYLSGANPLRPIDLTPFAFMITGIVVNWGLFRYGFLDIVPVARDRVIEMMGEGVIVADAQRRILDLNPAARRLLGAPLGKDFTQPTALFVGQDLDDALARWPELEKNCNLAQDARVDFLLYTPQGKRFFEAHISPIYDYQGAHNGGLIILRDITARKQVESDLRHARDAAEAASRAKSTFLGVMGHELRTPLTVIIGYTELLRQEAQIQGQPKTVERLERVEASAHHLLELVNDVLDFSQIEAGRMELASDVFDISGVVHNALAQISSRAKQSNNTLHIELAPDLGQMKADMARVRQVLLNLLDNANKFTENGQIIVRVKRVVEESGNWLIVEIADTGIGMTQEQLGGLFQAFTQADMSMTRKYGGTGLGLVISQRLCQMMGGEISVESTPGVGSMFTIRLPIV
jgi:PAS domain S-box-containing protein